MGLPIAGYKGKGQNRSKSKKIHLDFNRTEFQRGDLVNDVSDNQDRVKELKQKMETEKWKRHPKKQKRNTSFIPTNGRHLHLRKTET